MIQIRNVPAETHQRLKMLALRSGMSLSEFLLREITAVADRPSLDELVERIGSRAPVELSDDDAVAKIIREARGPLP